MIVLDTNVVSEAMSNDLFPGVKEWLNEQSAGSLCLSSGTLAAVWRQRAPVRSGRHKPRIVQNAPQQVALSVASACPFALSFCCIVQ